MQGHDYDPKDEVNDKMADWKLSTLCTQEVDNTQRDIDFEAVVSLSSAGATAWVKQGREEDAAPKVRLLLSAPAMLAALQAIERLARVNLQTSIKHIAQAAIKEASSNGGKDTDD